jgi:hypothetical protein
MAVNAEVRAERIEKYAAGAARLREAIGAVPPEARQFRPGPDKWSAHEVVVHCADSETNAAMRVRYLLAEKEPRVVAYDEAQWARTLDYHAHPLDTALATVDAVRAHTVALLRRLPEEAWSREGVHTDSGRYTMDDWLRIYADHVHNHADQVDRAHAAWKASRG